MLLSIKYAISRLLTMANVSNPVSSFSDQFKRSLRIVQIVISAKMDLWIVIMV